jgi:SAM-dependent methyltransferase
MDLEKYKGIQLDIGCGSNKQPGFVGMDKREIPEVVDIVHDLEEVPYPLEDESCITIVGSHVWEHLKPWLTIDIMNELWRIMKPGGRLALSMPYGWSYGFVQDPTHCNPSNVATWQYFDPRYPLWIIYQPKPWKIVKGFPVWQETGNMEVVLEKLLKPEDAREEDTKTTS